jgi:adenylate cyclase
MDHPVPEHPILQSDLLRRHEMTGLRLLAWLHLAATVLSVLGGIFTAQGGLRFSNFVIALLPFGIFLLIILRVEKVRHLEDFGLMIALFDSVIMLWMPVSWFLFQGDGQFPQLLVKNDLVIFYILLAGIQSITLRPKQPLLVGAIGVLGQVGCFFWAQSIGLPPVTSEWLTAINTPQVDIGSFWFKTLAMLPFGCITLAILAARGRQLVMRSVSMERSVTALSRYFSPEIVGELISNNNPLDVSQNGQQRDVAILFVDIVSFTALRESLPPDDVVSLLADYYQRMVACVFANKGSVDKFLGDGLMATFNMLGDQPQAARQAVLAGLAMQKAIGELNAVRQVRGLPPLRQRIGIHFGPAVVGNVGTAERMEFTAIGDTVNTASRLQEMGKQLQFNFLISEPVYRQFPQLPVQDMGLVNVRGKANAMRVYAVIAP